MLENKEHIKTYIKEKRKLFSNAIKVLDGWDNVSSTNVDEVSNMIKAEKNQSHIKDKYQCLTELLRYEYLSKEQLEKLAKDMEDRGFVL